MSIESIPSALLTVGSGGIIGFLIGFAIKRVMKVLAVVAGLFFGVLFYLQSQNIININWDKLQSISESSLSFVANSIFNTQQVPLITSNLGISLTGGISAGLVLGLSKG